MQLAVNDIDLVDFKFITGIVPDSIRVEMYSDILADADHVTLTPVVDFVTGGLVDTSNGEIDNFGVTITNAALFEDVQDIVITFRATTIQVVPEPSTLVLVLVGGAVGIFAARRRCHPVQRH